MLMLFRFKFIVKAFFRILETANKLVDIFFKSVIDFDVLRIIFNQQDK